MSSSYTTVSDAIKADHRELESYYKVSHSNYAKRQNFCDAKTNDKKEEWRNQFVWELARHSIGEELIVYPAFEKYLGTKGQKLADTDRKEHQTVKEELYKLQNTSVEDSTTLDQLFDTLMTDLTDHIKHEESNDLPALEKQLKQDESQSMAASFERTKQFVPTRYHLLYFMLTIGLILVRRINHLLRLLWDC
jgi:iron-sulfur cluster repair protein YtfE (RIC family)